MKKYNIWVLVDNRIGSNTQSLGVANSFGMDYETKEIKYKKSAKLPNFIKGASLIGIDEESKKNITAPYPDIVIAAGRNLAAVARYIKKKSPKTRLIQLMYPGCYGLSDFDLVAVPKHDTIYINRKNILKIDTSPHTITSDKLTNAKEKWADKISSFPTPITTVFIGGSTKNKEFTVTMAENLGNILNTISKKHNGTIFITTSRRTSPKCEEALKNAIPDPRFFYSWSDGGDSPYFAFMAGANNIIVTGDSVSMASEATSMGVPVYIYNPDDFMKGKHEKFINSLYNEGIAMPLPNDGNVEFKDCYENEKSIINSADKIVEEFNKLLATK